MGCSAALEAIQRYPGIDKRFGDCIRKEWGSALEYNLFLDTETNVGAFQVKYNWSDLAELKLIERSLQVLTENALGVPDVKIAWNFPGIVHGTKEANKNTALPFKRKRKANRYPPLSLIFIFKSQVNKYTSVS